MPENPFELPNRRSDDPLPRIAVLEEQVKNLYKELEETNKRVDGMNDERNWFVRLVIGAIVVAALSYIIKNGGTV